MKYNPDVQKLVDIDNVGRNYWLRIHCTDGEVFEGYADCWTYLTAEDDEDVDAMLFCLRDGGYREIAGTEIEQFEILERR